VARGRVERAVRLSGPQMSILHRHPARKVAFVALQLLLIPLALIGACTLTRGTPVRSVLAIGDREGPPPVGDSLFAHTMELFSGTLIEPGNHVEVLANGVGTYPRVWQDVRAARQTITVQMYFSQPGAIADSMAALLKERARAGVRVKVLLDAFGSKNLSGKWEDSLTAAGVRVAWLRPLHWYTLYKANNRSHVRVLVVDGRVGYTGGFGLADYWQGDGRSEEEWRESNVRFEGPSVMHLQAAFAAAWAEATGELLTGDLYFPSATFVGQPNGVPAGLLYTQPTIGSTNAERFMALSIAGSRRRLWITNSYFVPDDDFRRGLTKAARRGVDVRILTAGPKTDVKTTTWAGRARYRELLEAGVKIYEYQPTMMHAKTMVVDGVWSTVGSMNFDNRSLAYNNESNLLVLDPKVGATLDSLFLDDITRSDEMTLAEVKAWGLKWRLLSGGANLLSKLL
jgi:cardiolipin synthase A/B